MGRNNIFLKPPTPANSFGPQRSSLFHPENGSREGERLQLNQTQNSFSASDINHFSTIQNQTIRGTQVVGNAALIEQSNIIPHLARAYLEKRETSQSRFNSQLQQPKNKNYHPDTLIKKLIDYKKKPDHLLTLAATGTTAKSSLVDTLSMRSKSRSPSPIPPVGSANKAITIQIDFPRGTPTPKVNFRSNKASIHEGPADH
jgi:hypothetical protein